ncbi:hypothetical protein FHT78_000080 [Rhizobium sp. BK196]|jgi:hypothetical protein|nr:hypothetical protein [Rhizobium sp. BK196]
MALIPSGFFRFYRHEDIIGTRPMRFAVEGEAGDFRARKRWRRRNGVDR